MNQDYDDTARLILMDKPRISFMDFAMGMKEMHPELKGSEGLPILYDLGKKYRGFDGRIRPSHDFITGLPLTKNTP